MKEVRIYHTPWGGKIWWAILVSLGFVGLFVWLIVDDPTLGEDWRFWFGLISFGIMAFFFPLVVWWERLSGRPAVVVMADKVVFTALWRRSEYRFDEVKRFELTQMSGQEFISVHFDKQEEQRRLQDASKTGRAVRRLNIGMVGAQENIATSGLTMKPQELCDLLNWRLANDIH